LHGLFFAVIQILTQAHIHFLFCTERVWIFDNKLNGTIPTEIGNLVNLVEFNVGLNSLTGSIPSTVGQLENLGK
jgi:hypothetical protein